MPESLGLQLLAEKELRETFDPRDPNSKLDREKFELERLTLINAIKNNELRIKASEEGTFALGDIMFKAEAAERFILGLATEGYLPDDYIYLSEINPYYSFVNEDDPDKPSYNSMTEFVERFITKYPRPVEIIKTGKPKIALRFGQPDI